ncbi:HesA/MoeB/ThiF family protein [Vulgatibacter incomptus]|uniref:Sulfur carrier protein adenylyltransferase ThiF n=1 Tax=Vulgatibacter incomptus TaxID=1391653 RepID=A0A0K1PE33_9BACT|nr:HesA/MoeB/ThiF family protein [Vulgatibacter incomptus]AKU91752.1 Sulfur carrier protein adenylyltransferase ThiF [Vulgatibacter incomptus]
MGRTKRALVIGAGGLGSATLPLLARSGVELRVFDDDVVSLSNLQRQLLFRTRDVGRPKVDVALERLAALVPGARVEGIRERLTVENAEALAGDADVVLDGSDNFATRFLVNDACVLVGTPLVHGGILRFTGQVLAVMPKVTSCYRCLFEAPPAEGVVPSCAEAGVLGALCGIVGARMATAAGAILSGAPVGDLLLVHDALTGRDRGVKLGRDPSCAVCGDEPTIRALDAARYGAEACAA